VQQNIVNRFEDGSDDPGDERKYPAIERVANSNRSSFSIDSGFGTDDDTRSGYSFSFDNGDDNGDDNSDDSFAFRRRRPAVQERDTRDVLMKSKGAAQAIAEDARAVGGLYLPSAGPPSLSYSASRVGLVTT
jgi:hypothetical protein